MDEEDTITRRRALLAGGATLAFGGGVAYVASRSGTSEREYVPSAFHRSDETTGFGVELAGRPIAGERDAPVDVYYWTDYLCPFCKEFETGALPEIGRNYLDTGEARLVTLLYPNIGEYSTPAAVWDRCVWRTVADADPAAYWNWHGEAFDAQAEQGSDWADEATFRSVTESVEGVAVADVDECRDARGDSVREAVEVDADAATSAGIRGTPGFVLYNRETETAGKLVGAHPYDTFSDALDQVLQS